MASPNQERRRHCSSCCLAVPLEGFPVDTIEKTDPREYVCLTCLHNNATACPQTEIETTVYQDQKPGTSGLRKKVTVFQQPHYLANFIQATFNAVRKIEGKIPPILVVGGDGRFYGQEACKIIARIAAANGVKRLWIGQDGLLSTPAVSAIVRNREGGYVATGAFILTASHNPGGPNADFGIKYNCANGGPAPEKITNLIFEETKILKMYKMCQDIDFDLCKQGEKTFGSIKIEIIDSTADYVKLLTSVFDFPQLKKLIARPDFSFVFDSMNGVGGPYAKAIFLDVLGGNSNSVLNSTPLSDFGGIHPDPNLSYAEELVSIMGLLKNGDINPKKAGEKVPDFGAASDGDADRNMVLGARFFVTPSDSVAIIAANSQFIPFLAGGLKAVARSMPTSAALDRVATALNIPLFEVPTGWKFFGNLMDCPNPVYTPLICGEESFGTGSNHVREKDGIWAVLSWLSILAGRNQDASKPLVSVEDIVREHWQTFGRNYYTRYDYENVSTEAADKVMNAVRASPAKSIPSFEGHPCTVVDDFEYKDPVDGQVTSKQGIRVMFDDGSRFVLRLSGTGSSGATIRLYVERYFTAAEVKEMATSKMPSTSEALKDLVEIALTVSQMEVNTGMKGPTVIT